MMRLILICVLFGIVATACLPGVRVAGDVRDRVAAIPPTPSLQNIQILGGNVLPPYGMKVSADRAVLTVQVSSSEEEVAGRLEDIQQTVEHMSALAAGHETITLESISVNQVASDAGRSTPESYIRRIEASSAVAELAVRLVEPDRTLLESLLLFNDFLNNLELVDTITVQPLSIETKISDPEAYRPQIIAKVYQEVAAVQEEYGDAVKFEVTGLHGGLQIIQLTDTDYYLYLQPTINVTEF